MMDGNINFYKFIIIILIIFASLTWRVLTRSRTLTSVTIGFNINIDRIEEK